MLATVRMSRDELRNRRTTRTRRRAPVSTPMTTPSGSGDEERHAVLEVQADGE